MINRRIFGQPPDLVVSNFRILRRDVVDRIFASRTAYPYITGPGADVLRRPRERRRSATTPRSVGKSNYSLVRILRLVLHDPVQLLAPARCAPPPSAGFAHRRPQLHARRLLPAARRSSPTPGRGLDHDLVLVSLFSGFIIALLSMLGEYVVRTLNAVSAEDSLPRRSDAVQRPVSRALPRASARNGAARPTSTTCSTAHPRDRDGPPGAARSRRSSCPTRSSSAGATWYRAQLFAPRRRPRPCSARRAPATSSAAAAATASARSSATRGSSSSCATPSSGRCRTGSSARDHGLEDRPLAEALEQNLTGPRDWDPTRDARCRRTPTSSAAATPTSSALAGDVPRTGARPVPRGPARRPRPDRRPLRVAGRRRRPSAPTSWDAPVQRARTSRPATWARTSRSRMRDCVAEHDRS